MKQLLYVLIPLIVLFLVSVNPVNADKLDSPCCQETVEENVFAMVTKLARGIVNVATGWVELPRTIYVDIRDKGPAKGIILGPFNGIGMAIVRTTVGAFEAGTFMVPYKGFYGPYMDRPLVWSDYFEDEGLLIYETAQFCPKNYKGLEE
jgi:putative exosortase-associated protein (TIGR04073 family)